MYMFKKLKDISMFKKVEYVKLNKDDPQPSKIIAKDKISDLGISDPPEIALIGDRDIEKSRDVAKNFITVYDVIVGTKEYVGTSSIGKDIKIILSNIDKNGLASSKPYQPYQPLYQEDLEYNSQEMYLILRRLNTPSRRALEDSVFNPVAFKDIMRLINNEYEKLKNSTHRYITDTSVYIDADFDSEYSEDGKKYYILKGSQENNSVPYILKGSKENNSVPEHISLDTESSRPEKTIGVKGGSRRTKTKRRRKKSKKSKRSRK